MVKIFKNLSIFVVAIILFSQAANAQIIITKLGTHPFYRPSLASKSDLFSMIGYNVDDIEKGFELAGMSSVFDDFIDQVFDTKITKVNLGDGTKLEWMFHRKYGKGPVLLAQDITWINKEAIEAYQFNIDSGDKRYTFSVPFICNNISLRGVTGIPINDVYSLNNTGLEDGIVGSIDIDGDNDKIVSNSQFIINRGIDIDGDGVIDGVDIDGDGIVDVDAGIDLDGDGIIDGYDVDGDGKIDIQSSAALAARYGIDLDGDGIIDGVDIDGDGIIDADAGIDLDGDGIIDGYDVDGDGKIDILSSTTLNASHGYDINGDGIIDAKVGIDIDDDDTIDYYDVDGDGSIDVKAGATAAAVTGAKAASLSKNPKDGKEHECGEDCTKKHIYCGKPGWKLGIFGGFPLGSAPEDESFNMGVLLETPLGVKLGPLNIGLGLGAFTYDFDNIYFGGGALASLCINELLKLDMPIKLQLHGAGFYVFGEESGPGFGGIASASLPLGNTPLGLGIFYGGGKYYPGEKDYNWANIGAVLFYDF